MKTTNGQNTKEREMAKQKKTVHFANPLNTNCSTKYNEKTASNVKDNGEKSKNDNKREEQAQVVSAEESENEIQSEESDSESITFLPASVESKEEIERDSLSNISFSKINEYNLTRFPWPIKNKYLVLSKIYGMPFDRIGRFQNVKPKVSKHKEIDLNNRIINETIDEATQLFTETGYEDELAKWLAYFWRINPRNHTKYVPHYKLTEGEYNQHFEELKVNLALENELAYELQQIKLLCGIIDEENYGLDGRPRNEWDAMVNERIVNYEICKFRNMVNKLNEINHKIFVEKKRIKLEKQNQLRSKREQTLEDLKLWKNYVRPEMEDFIREKPATLNDGRIRDWFECVYIHEVEGRQAPVKLFTMSEILEEPKTIFDKESISNIEDFVPDDD